MSLYVLKPCFQRLLRPSLRRLVAAGLTANHVTIAALVGSIGLGGLLFWRGPGVFFLLLPAWLVIRMALNALDGMMAREFKQASRLGAFLNEIGDLISDVALIAPFALLPVFGWVGILALLLLALMTEFVGVMAPMVGSSRRYDGPLGKSDRAFLIGLGGLWIGAGLPVPAWAVWLLPLIALGLILTMVNRIRRALAEVRLMEEAKKI